MGVGRRGGGRGRKEKGGGEGSGRKEKGGEELSVTTCPTSGPVQCTKQPCCFQCRSLTEVRVTAGNGLVQGLVKFP